MQLSPTEKQKTLETAIKLPSSADGMKIGLFGGSFNPPHEGHVHVCETALKRGQLDQIWWLVTPGNPLKDTRELEDLATRVKKCCDIITHPKMKVTAFEANYNLRYSEETLSKLLQLRPNLNFVWVMGADNLKNFHKWKNWRKIADQVPMMIIDRPGSTLAYRSAQAAISLSRFRLDETDSELLATSRTPAWSFIHAPRSSLSSTAIRNARKKAGKSNS